MNTNLINEMVNNILMYKANINTKNNINKNILSCYKNIEELKKLVNSIDDKLMQQCDHQWKRDHTYYGEHSQYTCFICGLYR